MSIDELAAYIEQTYGKSMSPYVRAEWSKGWAGYYKRQNPDDVRRSVFMALLRNCWQAQPSGELRNALATLYLKLRKQQVGTTQ